MRQIKYILIHDTLPENGAHKCRNRRQSDSGYHYIVNSAAVVLNPIDIHMPGLFMPIAARGLTDYNACSIGIQYNRSLSSDLKLAALNAKMGSTSPVLTPQHMKLIDLLVDLRSHFPDAKILGVKEIHGESIRPTAEMNQLRRELSDYP